MSGVPPAPQGDPGASSAASQGDTEELAPRLSWQPRLPPLAVEGVAVRGSAARALARKLLTRPRQELRGVQAGSLLVILGPEEHLPWCPGAVYLGRESPHLYLPTRLQPLLLGRIVPAGWLSQALAPSSPPWAVLPVPGGNEVIGLSRCSAVDGETLEQFLKSRADATV